jgi:hemoglobin/transferrin/lactoferrin receptor protein
MRRKIEGARRFHPHRGEPIALRQRSWKETQTTRTHAPTPRFRHRHAPFQHHRRFRAERRGDQRAESVFETPFTAHVIGTERFLAERNVRSLADALSETPGVLVQKTGYGQASPFIRGFTGFRTLLLIDGIRLNNAVFREGPNQYFSTIDHLTIGRLEVVKGPSSVLFGSDAIGGTVNAITRAPEMIPRPQGNAPVFGKDGRTLLEKTIAPLREERFAFHPGAYYRYASAENSHIARGELGLSIAPHVGILGGVTWKDFDDLRGGRTLGLQPNTGYEEIDGDVKVLIRPSEHVDVTAAFFRVEQNNAPRTHSTVFAKSFDGTAVGTDLRRDFDQRRELAYLQAEVRDAAPWLSTIRFSMSFHRQAEWQDRIRDNSRRELADFTDDQYGVFLTLESPSPIGTWTYGAEYYRDEVQSGAREFNADGSLRALRERGPVADDSSYDLLGVFVQNQFKPWKPLEITLGARYSAARAQADGGKIDPDPADALAFADLDESFDALTASARFRLDVARNWNFFGGASQGFRAPNLSDFTSFELARSGERETPAYDLDPERYISFEFGTKARSERLRASVYASYFHTLIDDQIIRLPTGGTIDGAREVTRANAGEGHIHGVEFGAEWNFWRGFTAFGNLSWAEGEVDTFLAPGEIARRPASRIQPFTGLLGLRWESEDRRWFLEGTAQLARHQDRLSPGDELDTQRIPPGGTRGYQVFSLRGSYQPWAHTRLFAAVENVTDEDYRHLGSGTNEPGTNAVVGAQVRF